MQARSHRRAPAHRKGADADARLQPRARRNTRTQRRTAADGKAQALGRTGAQAQAETPRAPASVHTRPPRESSPQGLRDSDGTRGSAVLHHTIFYLIKYKIMQAARLGWCGWTGIKLRTPCKVRSLKAPLSSGRAGPQLARPAGSRWRSPGPPLARRRGRGGPMRPSGWRAGLTASGGLPGTRGSSARGGAALAPRAVRDRRAAQRGPRL